MGEMRLGLGTPAEMSKEGILENDGSALRVINPRRLTGLRECQWRKCLLAHHTPSRVAVLSTLG